MRTLIVYLLLVSFLFTQSVVADDKAELTLLTKDKITQVIQMLRQKSLDKATRDQKILEAVDPMFDFSRMAQLSLGKKYWVAMTKKQQSEFVDLFVKKLKASYLEKLDLYTDEDVLVEDAKEVKKRINVLTHLVSKGDKKEMIYKFYKTKEGWKVYDVEILGVSLVQTYRSQFDGVLKKGTTDELLTKLKSSDEFTIPTGTEKSSGATPSGGEEEEN